MAGTPFVSVYENLNADPADTVANYTWKYDHEYIVYVVERHKRTELGMSYTLTLRSAIGSSDRGFIAKHIDCYVIFDQQDMKIKTQTRQGDWCPIVKILERPVTFGVTDHTSENWEEWWTGTAAQVSKPWEDDYEYFVLSSQGAAPGNIGWSSFVTSLHFFIPEEFEQVPINGECFMRPTVDGGIKFWRPHWGGNKSSRYVATWGNVSIISHIYRRKIRFDTAPSKQFNSWFKKQIFGFPYGVYAGNKWRDAKPCNWVEDKEVIMMTLDCSGPDELASSYFFTDSAMFTLPSSVMNYSEGGMVCESGVSHFTMLNTPNFARHGVKTVHTYGDDGATVFVMYEKLDVLADDPVIIVPPEPDPKPPSCSDCVRAGSIWEQTANIEVKFLKPVDWQLRNYRYVWSGDIGNGNVELLGTEDKGRIAKIRFAKQMAVEDSSTFLPVNIVVEVFDEDYSAIGISDKDSAVISFELPCVILANEPNISIQDLSIIEGDVDNKILLKISASEPAEGGDITVDWTTVEDTATNNVDYYQASGTATIVEGSSEAIVEIMLIGDDILESNETFIVRISNASRGNIVKDTGIITILDDDASPCGVDTPAGGAGVTETTHFLGSNPGRVIVTFEMYGVQDKMEIFYEGNLVAATSPGPDGKNVPGGNILNPGFVSDQGNLSFDYFGPPRATSFMIRMTGPDGTEWNYKFNCPVPFDGGWDGKLDAVPTLIFDPLGNGTEFDAGLFIMPDGSIQATSASGPLGYWSGAIANSSNSEVKFEVISGTASVHNNAPDFSPLASSRQIWLRLPLNSPVTEVTIRVYLREAGSTTAIVTKDVVLKVGSGGTGGGGNGCFIYGTLIDMADGTKKKIEDIVVGDKLKTLLIPDMPDASAEDPTSYFDWSEIAIAPTYAECYVKDVDHNSFSYYYKIFAENMFEPLCITVEHPVLVKFQEQGMEWHWDTPARLRIGDYLYNNKMEAVKILTIEIVVEKINTANLNVENLDTYFANGIFVHNSENTETPKEPIG
jgi:hypothetical protein